jgi:hypothetical protein
MVHLKGGEDSELSTSKLQQPPNPLSHLQCCSNPDEQDWGFSIIRSTIFNTLMSEKAFLGQRYALMRKEVDFEADFGAIAVTSTPTYMGKSLIPRTQGVMYI